ncbi:MAG: hypothetical protein K2H18_02545 [Muribaculaceae bacterium]|nr:hypothetical protein [Muribaculaceae bacterium]
MKKKEELRDYEFSGAKDDKEKVEDMISSEFLAEEESEEESNRKKQSFGRKQLRANEEEREEGSEEESKDESEKKREDERKTRLERCFSSYPSTLEFLLSTPGYDINENMEKFMAGVEGFCRGSGRNSEEIDSALKMLFSIGIGCRDGRLSLDMVEIMMKGSNYDKVLAEETRKAELRGRNARIEAEMRTRTAGDGVPHLESRGTGTMRKRGIFSLAEDARR